ncbi:jumonji domain containing protein-related including hairless [Schistosoma mansoni]|uniref:jumonji domain containing protein-related including hairless n=1 Tax=Schistosoma mansoni TaxID=6183 RepID=UPI00022DC744|nr:jumonji domain containing protein-related including hairless [Schistosoma mansoni]|eukprot:XP_018649140.1 jumonji domain containing protein-related including hairless [Schistosoma mansoni]
MLPKKKRWMASAHTSSTNLISSPSTVNTISNIGSKKLCCDTPIQTVESLSRSLPNSVVSTQLPVRTLATGNLISTGDPYSLSMLQQQSLVDRSTSNLTTEYLHSDHKSQVVTSRQSSHPVKSTLPGRRNDVNPNLITTISHYPTELLQQQQQQPGLLLQVLPQEYLANYAQNLAKLNVNKNSGDLMHLPSNNCSTGSKINKMDTLSSVQNTGYSQGLLHQPDTQGRQTHISTHNNLPNLPLRIKSPDNSKIQRTSQSLRSSPMLNSPVFQYPAPNNSQRFSPPPHPPPRRLSGSGEQTRHNKPLTQSHQLPSGFDLPTISAVARAASMLSPSQLEAAAVLLSQWDNVNQLALLANNSSYRNLNNIVDSSGNKQPVNSRTMSDLRYPSMKNSLSLPRSMDQLTNRLNSRSSTPGNEPMNKYDHMCCPPWSTTDQRAYSTDSSHSYKLQPSPHDHTVELADSRLAILHDAKLASLSVDWPSCTMPQNIPMSKANRIRSSGSLSSPVCLTPTSFSNTTSESSFSTNQLHTKAATTSSSQSLSSVSFVTSESLVRSPTSDHCSPTIPVNFNPKGPTLQTESPISSCCQTIKSLSPNTGITRVLNSSQSQFSAISGGKSPTGYSLCGQFLPTNTNSINNNDTIELSNHIESNRISNCPGKLSTLSEQYKRHPLVGTPNVMPTLLPQPKQECIRTKFTVDTNISDHRSQNTSMPLKKRLIQRYEADRVDMKPSELSTCNLVKTELPMDNSHNRSTNADDLKNKQYSPESRIAMKDNVIEKLDCQERKFKRKKRTKYETDGMSSLNTNKNKPTKIHSAQTVYGVGSGGNLRKPKRTATLAVASGTTIGSTIITAKKPRLSSVSSLTTTKPTTMMMEGKTVKTTSKQHRRGDNGKSRTTIHREDGDDSTVCMKFKTDLLNQDDYTLMCENSMADELSAALAEENFQFEKLVEQLPGPPDCITNLFNKIYNQSIDIVSFPLKVNRTANKSLHSTHSLNFYKRSQRVFVQLINCNDPGLKQNPKLIISDIPSPTNSQNFSNGLNKDIQFKKPPGRRTTLGKNTRKENINDKSKNKRNSTHPSMSVFCRFWGFRKLCYNNRGVLKIADFCRSTESDALERSLWEMYHPVSPFLSTGAAKYLLECAGGLFCRLLHQELTSLNNNHAYQSQNEKINSLTGKNRISGHTMESNNKNDGIINSVAWKRPVKGVREMCDVCETTMFNTHWVCGKCGYSVCTDCLNESKSSNSVGGSNLDTRDHVKFNENGAVEKKGKLKYIRGRGCPYGWASCTTTRQHHDPNKLLLTSLLPSGIIGRLIHRLHRIANYYKINLGCNCSPSSSTVGNDATDLSNDTLLFMKPMKSLNNRECLDRNSLDLLADIALKADMGNTGSLTTGNSNNSSNGIIDNVVVETEFNASHNNPSFITTDNGVSLSDNDNNNERKMIMMDFPSHSWIHCTRRHINQRSCYQKINDAANTAKHKTKHNDNHGFDFHRESNLKIYKPSEIINRHHHHNPVFLRLHCPDSVGNLLAFQSEWRRNHPLVISGCQRKFTQELWTPQSFSNDFGDMKTTLIDCATGAEISRYTLKSFWDGFEKRERRITSKDGRPLCLKLKDWPTTDDFAELQPKRFNDLMLNLPMPNYTQRDGQLNLAARLSSFFVCPDLGPKLYVAYGTVGSCSISTTNLHVDIADAVNVMLYVGQPTDSLNEMLTNAESIVNTLTSAHIDDNYLERVLNWLNKIKSHQTDVHTNENNNNNTNNTTTTFSSTTHETDSEDIPGALWHIFLPEDSNGLREFLSRVSENETGTPVESGSDPIHDQLFYMDQSLLDRLYDCTGIQPCTIVQFHGDAVFIPAGAAHQVVF